MSSATRLCGVVDQAAARAAEFVVEHDLGSERGEACAQADAKVVERAGAVAFESENVFEGPEDRFDPLSDRSEMRPVGRGVTVGLWGDLRRRPQRRGWRG